MVEQLT